MDDEFSSPDEKGSSSQKTQKDSWQDVGDQFEAFGYSLGNALRTAWNDENNRAFRAEMQQGLNSMVKELDQVIQETAQSETGQQVRNEAKKIAHNLQNASEQTYQEYKPQMVKALRQVSQEFQKLVDRLDNVSKPE